MTPAPALRHSALLGLGSHRGSRVVPNAEVVEAIDSSDEWIQQRSGIVERRWATDEETLLFMCVSAAREAVEAAGIQPGQLDAVIVATVTHLKQTPAVATLVAHELGTTAAAFDISAACAGFCHALALGSDLVRAGTARHVLVIGAERLSDLLDLHDRSTAFIFADGAGAAVVGPSEEQGIGPVVWGSEGEHADLIRQEPDWPAAVAAGRPAYLAMEGNQVFRWAAFSMAKIARETLDRSGVDIAGLAAFVPHQANQRITDVMVRSLDLPEHVVVARDVTHMGNTSAASVPLALKQLVDDGAVASGDLALLIAFGAGLSYAAQVVRVP